MINIDLPTEDCEVILDLLVDTGMSEQEAWSYECSKFSLTRKKGMFYKDNREFEVEYKGETFSLYKEDNYENGKIRIRSWE